MAYASRKYCSGSIHGSFTKFPSLTSRLILEYAGFEVCSDSPSPWRTIGAVVHIRHLTHTALVILLGPMHRQNVYEFAHSYRTQDNHRAPTYLTQWLRESRHTLDDTQKDDVYYDHFRQCIIRSNVHINGTSFSLEGLHHVLQNGMSGTQSWTKVRLARQWRLCKFVYQPFSTSYILLKFGRRINIRQFSVTLLIWNRGMFEVIVHDSMSRCAYIRLTDQRTSTILHRRSRDHCLRL